MVAGATNRHLRPNFTSNFRHLTDPVKVVDASSVSGVYNFLGSVPLALFVVWGVSVVLRLVRSRGEERVQLTWFAYSAVVASVAIAISTAAASGNPIGFEKITQEAPATAAAA